MKQRQGQVLDVNWMLDADKRNATANLGHRGSPATCGEIGSWGQFCFHCGNKAAIKKENFLDWAMD